MFQSFRLVFPKFLPTCMYFLQWKIYTFSGEGWVATFPVLYMSHIRTQKKPLWEEMRRLVNFRRNWPMFWRFPSAYVCCRSITSWHRSWRLPRLVPEPPSTELFWSVLSTTNQTNGLSASSLSHLFVCSKPMSRHIHINSSFWFSDKLRTCCWQCGVLKRNNSNK